jgi:hypothetical protein
VLIMGLEDAELDFNCMKVGSSDSFVINAQCFF